MTPLIEIIDENIKHAKMSKITPFDINASDAPTPYLCHLALLLYLGHLFGPFGL